jgi:hypothetical protein
MLPFSYDGAIHRGGWLQPELKEDRVNLPTRIKFSLIYSILDLELISILVPGLILAGINTKDG